MGEDVDDEMCEFEAVTEKEFANIFEDDGENIQLAREEEQDVEEEDNMLE